MAFFLGSFQIITEMAVYALLIYSITISSKLHRVFQLPLLPLWLLLLFTAVISAVINAYFNLEIHYPA
jgi:hypothetical protein